MSIALAALASLIGFLGVLLSGSAVIGPSVVGFAILLALLARLAQSHDHHKAWQAAQGPQKETVPAAQAGDGSVASW
ncbi:MAG TPA: hypothetical protein VKB50_09790 [Vicinamibacterales bacterium]|nr:hypothetical protein [Vicinamibacterales bacterium]